jgi:hypothetical protein
MHLPRDYSASTFLSDDIVPTALEIVMNVVLPAIHLARPQCLELGPDLLLGPRPALSPPTKPAPAVFLESCRGYELRSRASKSVKIDRNIVPR